MENSDFENQQQIKESIFEWLKGNEQKIVLPQDVMLIRVNHHEGLDFIYNTEYRSELNFKTKLEFYGFYIRNTGKFYTVGTLYPFYKITFEHIGDLDSLIHSSMTCRLNDYFMQLSLEDAQKETEKQQEELEKKTKNYLMKDVESAIISNRFNPQLYIANNDSYIIDKVFDTYTKDYILEFALNYEETMEKYMNLLIEKEYSNMCFHKVYTNWVIEKCKEIYANPKEYKNIFARMNIYNSLDPKIAQTVKVFIECEYDGEKFESQFKMPTERLRYNATVDVDIPYYDIIEPTERDRVYQYCREHSLYDLRYEDVKRIEFRKKPLYERD